MVVSAVYMRAERFPAKAVSSPFSLSSALLLVMFNHCLFENRARDSSSVRIFCMPADLFGNEEAPDMPEDKPKKDTGAAAKDGGTTAAKAKQPKFEDAFNRLEELVNEMERGDQPLEELLDKFEEGVKLVRHCQEFLKQAQLRVEQYVEQKDGHWVLKELE